MPFGWGIVSTGKHPDVKIAPAMAAANGGELVGVYSRDQHRAEAFAQKHGARAAYSRLSDLLKDARVDGVFVSSPNALHAEHVVQAAEAGKHVLCEKPMATTIADAVRMLKACRRAGVTLGVAFDLRQHPAYIRARDLVAAGTLGRIVLAQAQWAFGVRGRDGSPPRTPLTQWWDTPELIGGASTMMGTGVHSVDLLRFVLGAEVDEITAVTDGQTVARPLEQLACLTLRFGNGTLGQVVASRLLPDSRNDFRVYGSPGSSPDTTPCGKRARAASRSRATPSTRPPTTRKRCCRTTWQRSRTSSARSPPAACQQRLAWTGCGSRRSRWR